MNEPRGLPAIVVGIDGSEDSKHALRWAAQQATLTNTPLQAITAWHYPVDFGTAWQIPATYGRSHDFSKADFSEDAKMTLDTAIAEVLGKDPQVPITLQNLVSGHHRSPAQRTRGLFPAK